MTVPLAVQDGALVVPDLLGGGPLELLAPLPDDAWHLTGASITTDGMDIDATVDVGRLGLELALRPAVDELRPIRWIPGATFGTRRLRALAATRGALFL